MEKIAKKIFKLCEPIILNLGFELVDVWRIGEGKNQVLRFYLDHKDGVSIENCTKISKQIAPVIDECNIVRGKYNLEVSSPGIERPLRTYSHFSSQLDKLVKIRIIKPLAGKTVFKGIVKNVEQDFFEIDCENNILKISFDLLERANLIFFDKK